MYECKCDTCIHEDDCYNILSFESQLDMTDCTEHDYYMYVKDESEDEEE